MADFGLGSGPAGSHKAIFSSLQALDTFDFGDSDHGVLGAGDNAALGKGGGLLAHHVLTMQTADAAIVVTQDGPQAAVAISVAIDFAEANAEQLLDSYVSGQGGLGVFSDFNIEVVFKGDGWTETLQSAFIKAAEYLSTIITGDVPDAFRGLIDDIRINAQISDIDGPGQVLGQAGPLLFRGSSSLPTFGKMEFDVADAEDFDAMDLFDDIVVHEMMHVLGLGTIWEMLDLVVGNTRLGMRFTGENAKIAYQNELSAISSEDRFAWLGVPVETDGGPGTAGGHWDDDTFLNELMTGFIGSPDDVGDYVSPNYVSSMTVAQFEDLGYETIWDASDPLAPIPQPDDLIV
ncbi:leishmanolysin-related zinc metalloendopeptidase [Pseudoroseicyclus sp. H15]